MVRGIKNFSEFFKDYSNEYVIIGGSAADIILEENGLSFRATQDVDLVLLTNTSMDLNKRIIEYVNAGEYKARETISGKQYYRFAEPKNETFPEIIEIFARNGTQLELGGGQYIIPIPTVEADKLSAILLDDEYFDLIKSNAIKSELGFSIINAQATICLKARAFRELTERKAQGGQVDSKDIRKHRNDILRLAQTLGEATPISLGELASRDLQLILIALNDIDVATIKQLFPGRKGLTKNELVGAIERSFVGFKKVR